MFFRCTNCQKEHEPPLPPAQSSTLSHCPDCGAPVTLIAHDTEPPPPGSDFVDPPGLLSPEPLTIAAIGAVRSFCRSCGGPYLYDGAGTLVKIEHAEKCDRKPKAVADVLPGYEPAPIDEAAPLGRDALGAPVVNDDPRNWTDEDDEAESVVE